MTNAKYSIIFLLPLLQLVLLLLFAHTAHCAPTTLTEHTSQQQQQVDTPEEDILQQRHKRQIWPGGFNNFGADDFGGFGGFGDNSVFTRPGNNNWAQNSVARPPRQRQRQRPGEELIFSRPPSENTIPSTDNDVISDDTTDNNNNNDQFVLVNNQRIVATMPPFTARTTPSPQFLNCFGSCLTTSEYNPICATNQQVYQNEQKFECARNCGADIQIVRRGSCEGLFAMQRG